MSLPAVSIADNSVASVCSGLGLVFPSVMEQPFSVSVSPSRQPGMAVSSLSSSPYMVRHPACLITLPFTVNSTPAHSAVTVAVSLTHFSENASIMRPATI